MSNRCPPYAMLILAGLALLPLLAQAGIRQKPGLWEGSVSMDPGGLVGGLSPEAVAQMEALGLELPEVEPIQTEFCLTPEQAAQSRLPQVSDPDSGCRVVESSRSGDRLRARLQCEGTMRGQGDVEVQLHSPESYSGTLRFAGASDAGLPLTLNSELSGRWVSANCGSVQPMQ